MNYERRQRAIIEVCAKVAASHGEIGQDIAAAIRAIELPELLAGQLRQPKYLYRKRTRGHRYLYFRLPEGTLIRLPDDEKSAEFRERYERCLKVVRTFAVAKIDKKIADALSWKGDENGVGN